MGVINQPRRSGSLGETPVGTVNFSEYTSGVKKSTITKQVIEIGTPKSPRALRALRPIKKYMIITGNFDNGKKLTKEM